MLAVTAYIVRGLQLLLGSTKRAMTERAEELGPEEDAIPLSVINRSDQPSLAPSLAEDLAPPPHAQDPSRVRGTGGPPSEDISSTPAPSIRPIIQAPLPLTRPQRWAFLMNTHFDILTFTLLFLFVGLPVYYASGYAMPAQITLKYATL
jgi:hypothetical protein